MKKYIKFILSFFCIACIILTGCSQGDNYEADLTEYVVSHQDSDAAVTGFSQYESVVLHPEAGGTDVCEANGLTIDFSNKDRGYLVAFYMGSDKIKLLVTNDDENTYTYDIPTDGSFQVIPITSGSGTYTIQGFSQLQDTEYKSILQQDIIVSLEDENLPFLYPNQYVNFNESSKAVEKSIQLAGETESQLQIIENIYLYCVENITYDHNKSQSVTSSYLPDVDTTLKDGTGICFDYAALMVSMLRSQGIPAKLEIGYAGASYHAWVSVYTTETGTICDNITFDGNWVLLDPTSASRIDEDPSLNEFICDTSNYVWMYSY